MAKSGNLYDDYWKEFHEIENNHEEEIEDDTKTPDGVYYLIILKQHTVLKSHDSNKSLKIPKGGNQNS